MIRQEQAFGVYVHVPFCASRCDYCAFVTYVGKDELHDRYARAVRTELTGAARHGAVPAASSVYFGGGTPSRLSPELIATMLDGIDRAPRCEVTMEINPEDAVLDRLRGYVAAGITRMSVGIQSTAPHVLRDLGRIHRGDDVRRVAEAVATCGVETFSMDLIVGSVSETDDDVRATLAEVLDHEWAPPHVSAYLLSVERGTPLSRDPRRHPSDDTLASRYELLSEELEGRGFDWYEVSNWSRPGHECAHNQLYWDQGDYRGVGAGAHSHRSGQRWWNVANLEEYVSRVEDGADPRVGEEILSASQRHLEKMILALRTRRGVPIDAIEDSDSLHGLLEVVDDRVVLTSRGRLLADTVARHIAESPAVPSRAPSEAK